MNLGKNASTAKYAVTVGTFDGVHTGHQAVLRTLVEEARTRNFIPLALTLDPHPLRIVAPHRAPQLLETPAHRLQHLRSHGVGARLLPFDAEVMHHTCAEWMALMKERYGMHLLVSGYDNRFGSDCKSITPAMLADIAASLGIELVTAPEIPGVSSSRIREAIYQGDMVAAASMLGRPYRLEGEVVKGRELGRTIGVPTANLLPHPDLLIPARGVYAAEVLLPDGSQRPAVVNIGNRPTVGTNLPVSIEAHIPGFSGNLYGSRLAVDFRQRIRDEKRFDSLAQLKDQISKDIEYLNQNPK